MVALKPQIVHESDAQRQHVRLPVPADVEINNKSFKAQGLSAGGVSIRNIAGIFAPGKQIPITLKFSFPGFALSINANTEIIHYNNSKKSLGCRFANLEPSQISTINHILKAYMTGDVVAANDLLHIAERNNFSNVRKLPSSQNKQSLRKQVAGIGFVALLGLAAAGFVAANIYESLFIAKSLDAVVTTKIINVSSASSGYFKSQIAAGVTTVKQGETIGTIAADGPSIPTEIKSPCECFITETLAYEGEYIQAGNKILSLVPVTTAPWIMAEIEPQKASRINLNAPAKIFITGMVGKYLGHIVDIKSGMENETSLAAQKSEAGYMTRPVQIKILPDRKLPVDLIARPARVLFDLH